jgi:hypothetical protein
MTYKYYQGVIKERFSTTTMLIIALLFSFVAAIGVYQSSTAATNFLDPFTQEELDNNWVTDRQYPSGGVNSVSFEGRNDVAAIGVIGENQFTPANGSTFYHFEGIKKIANFGTDGQIDLYVPSEWQDAAVVNVGFWASDDPLTAYPIIVYRNSAAVDAGFYTWDGVGGYVPSEVPVKYNDWNTLSISLDTEAQRANYSINGSSAGGIQANGANIGQVFLNHYNDGVRDYVAHWHAGLQEVAEPTKEDCKNGGWKELGFRNQGLCVSSFATQKSQGNAPGNRR